MISCPCFEDAVAFVAVQLGTSLGQWMKVGYNRPYAHTVGWEFKNSVEMLLWCSAAMAKTALGKSTSVYSQKIHKAEIKRLKV